MNSMSQSNIVISFDKVEVTSEYYQQQKRTYNHIHTWLRRHYGLADRCENLQCYNPSKSFYWAKVKGRQYDYNRDNFVMLCGRCHFYYDEKYRKVGAKKRL
jgi:hypothetical protein